MRKYSEWVEGHYGPARSRRRFRLRSLAVAEISAVAAFIATDLAGPEQLAAFRELLFVLGAAVVVLGLGLIKEMVHWSVTLGSALHRRVEHERLVYVAHHAAAVNGATGGPIPATLPGAAKEAALAALRDDGFPVFDADEATRAIGAAVLYPRACGFCGHGLAPVTCPTCKSLQWGDLDPRRLHVVLPAWDWRLAAFVDRFRFEILTSLIPFLVSTMLLVGGEAIVRAERVQGANEARWQAHRRELIRSTGAWRSALISFEGSCTSDEDREGSACRELLRSVLDEYVAWSWLTPSVVGALERRCPASTRPAQLACTRLVERESGTARADDYFRAWLHALWGGDDLRARRLAAANLSGEGKEVSCIVEMFELPDEGVHAVAYAACEALMEKGWREAQGLECSPDFPWGCGLDRDEPGPR